MTWHLNAEPIFVNFFNNVFVAILHVSSTWIFHILWILPLTDKRESIGMKWRIHGPVNGVITGSGHGLSPDRHLGITWTSDNLLSIGFLGIWFTEIYLLKKLMSTCCLWHVGHFVSSSVYWMKWNRLWLCDRRRRLQGNQHIYIPWGDINILSLSINYIYMRYYPHRDLF